MPRKKTKKSSRKRPFNAERFLLNCVESEKREQDWSYASAHEAGAADLSPAAPPSVDLRESWWKIDNQGSTGACVGYATAYGVLRWHFLKAARIPRNIRPSARFIWMADKETDEITSYPSTFLEKSGTQIKLALKVARKYGCVVDSDLPMQGPLSPLDPATFYSRAAQLRIRSFYNIGTDPSAWRLWLANQGPILTRLGVDRTWDQATATGGHLATYQPNTVRGGHAVCLVGYTPNYFIVRNSWGTGWGDKGFGYASNKYAAVAFTEAYGAVV